MEKQGHMSTALPIGVLGVLGRSINMWDKHNILPPTHTVRTTNHSTCTCTGTQAFAGWYLVPHYGIPRHNKAFPKSYNPFLS